MHTNYDRSGYASIKDLETEYHKKLFQELDSLQNEFLEKEAQFRSNCYKWPRNALHSWSRCWEYPFAMHHLRKHVLLGQKPKPSIIDFGSGVTFFPFAVARENTDVICVDIDPIVEVDLNKALQVMHTAKGSLRTDIINGTSLPYDDGKIDCIYSISVLEHTDDVTSIISEIARIMKSGGILILTIDIDLKGNFDIGPIKYNELRFAIDKYFTYAEAELCIHHCDTLVSNAGPYPLIYSLRANLSNIIRQLVGKTNNQYLLACQGYVLKRK